MNILKIVVLFLAGSIIIGTLLPFIRTDQWWIRIFDFPRTQILVLGLVVLIAMFFLYDRSNTVAKVIGVALGMILLIQCWHIYPYTVIQRKQVKAASDLREPIKIFVANVLQENRDHGTLLEQIRDVDPDIVLLTEVDQRWTDGMQEIEESLPHTVLHPLSNTYGMNLYSRFPLSGSEVRTLIDPNIPSIRTNLQLTSGRSVLFYGVHPLPPGIKHPHKDERQDSDQRDAELVVIAKEVADLAVPVIIAGDFNDVAWSHTTRLFQRTSRLLDPRVGRGFYNSFNAKSHLFRYPLDHLFHSDHFTLIDLQRQEYFGSDHFPIHVALNLEPEAKKQQEAPAKKAGDEKEAQEMLQRPNDKEE